MQSRAPHAGKFELSCTLNPETESRTSAPLIFNRPTITPLPCPPHRITETTHLPPSQAGREPTPDANTEDPGRRQKVEG